MVAVESNGSNSSPSGNRDGSGEVVAPLLMMSRTCQCQLTSEPEQEMARRYLERRRGKEEGKHGNKG